MFLKNLRPLTNPSPYDANLQPRGAPLGMWQGGFNFHHNTPKNLSNGTSRLFPNPTIRMGSGITTLREPQAPPRSNNPMYNALVNSPRKHVNALVDKRLLKPNPLLQPPTSSV
jgi:hypothetical protein